MELIRIIESSISITGIINCLLVGLFLYFSKKGIRKANRILSFLLLAICLKISFALIVNLNYPHEWNLSSMILFYFSEAGFVSFGPLLYLYYKAYLGKGNNVILDSALFVPSLIPFLGSYIGFGVPLWMMQGYFTIWLVIIFFQLKNYYSIEEKNNHFKIEKFWMNTLYASFVLIWLIVDLLIIDFEYYFLNCQ